LSPDAPSRSTRGLAAALLAAALAWECPRAGDTLTPGSDAVACSSMLAPGPALRCQEAAARGEPASPRSLPSEPTAAEDHPPPREEPAPREAGDREVDQFLADYGKPPRSAVRALLDPTDANIEAMRADQLRREIVAAYVAQRLTEMQSGRTGSSPARSGFHSGGGTQSDLPFFIGMQVTAYIPADCASCTALYRTLRQFIDANPAIDLQLVVIGDPGGPASLSAMLDGGLPVPGGRLSRAEAEARGIESAPVFEIRDARSGRRRLLRPDTDAGTLREQILALRKAVL